eukprot:1161326-Pelagomonas_calceolata.AAC.4
MPPTSALAFPDHAKHGFMSYARRLALSDRAKHGFMSLAQRFAEKVRNPATDSLLATMPLMKVNETRAAIAAADSVFPEWRRHTAKERSSILKRCCLPQCLVLGL